MERRNWAWVLLPWLGACGTTPAGAPDAALDTGAVPSDASLLPPYVDPYACEPAGTAPALDEPLGAAEARAGVVRRPEELVGGEGASGRVGHFKLYNNRVRFIVQGRTGPAGMARAAGYDLYGGNLLDADRVRPRGEPGQDLFREAFPLVGYRVGGADEVVVACDGSGGRPAALRVLGNDRPTRILGTFDALARERDVRVVTHYLLRPDRDVLEIRTVVQSNYGASLSAVAAGDFLGFGSAVALFTEGSGFGSAARAGGPVPWIAGASDPGEAHRRVSYALAPATGRLTVPLVDASGTAGLYDNLSAGRGERAEFVRYFSVGTGDVASAVAPLVALRAEPYGTVTGGTTPGALVYAFRDRYTAGGAARNQARAGMDGAFRMTLPPGSYELVALDRGRARGAPVAVTVTAGQASTASPSAGPTGTLVLDLALAGASPGERSRAPVKVSLAGMDVERPDGAFGELEGEREAQGMHRALFSREGMERVTVKPGRYRVTVSRGEEYDLAQGEVTVPAGGEATLRLDLRRAFETPGYVSGDFHQHTSGSIDSSRSLCMRVLENAAEGLEYAATTDHDNVTDFLPCVRELGLERFFNAMRGNEISVVGVGHFNAYPLESDPADPFAQVGAQYWADLPTARLFARVRAERSDPVLHVSHPRSNGFKGYFTSLALDPFTLQSMEPLARGWEALELNDSLGTAEAFLPSGDAAARAQAMMDASRVPVLRDWFALLRRGEHPCALANSDTHGRNDGSGWPHNLLRVGTDEPARVTPELVRQAIRAQRVVLSNGIVLRQRVRGQERMGSEEVVRPEGGVVDLELEVLAAPWVPARTVELYQNGRPMQLTPDGRGGYDAREATTNEGLTLALAPMGSVRLRATVHLRPTRDSFYVVIARGGSLAPVGARDAFGVTNPLYVDTDGNGWQPER
ncbi:MAG: CehA/McbA family metallohydrolase [Deltaproteobacteria bacterium]|nr:CehA/McbA family metallohydrolase [Deltaproteobacteria bacterium]